MISIPRAIVYVDLNVLEENYRAIKAKVPPRVKILCVVKADAYGHGAIEVARRLESNNVDYLGVATIDEGIELRDNGITAPILVMSGILAWDEVEPFYKNMLTPVIYDFNMLKRAVEEGAYPDRLLKVHIKIDTGMGRLGFNPDDMPFVAEQIKKAGNIKVEGFMSHFSSSEKRDEYGMNQIEIFKKALQVLRDNGINPEIFHMANSGAIVNYPEAYFDMVRVGISLYGSYPVRELSKRLHVKQVMRFISKIAHIREFPPGYQLSYGGTYTTRKKTKVAYVPVGYADGYPRALSNKGSVLIKDTRCSIIGRICMDWLLVDVTELEDVNVKEEVVLLGRSKTEVISADEIAEQTGTIPYEILCKISKKVLRVYV